MDTLIAVIELQKNPAITMKTQDAQQHNNQPQPQEPPEPFIKKWERFVDKLRDFVDSLPKVAFVIAFGTYTIVHTYEWIAKIVNAPSRPPIELNDTRFINFVKNTER